MERIKKDCSLGSKVTLISLFSIRILSILELTAKTKFSKISKCSSLVQERSDNLVQLLKDASKLVRAEQVAAEALGALGTHYSTTSPRLASLTEIASTRTMASMQLEDGLVQAKSRLETFKVRFTLAVTRF